MKIEVKMKSNKPNNDRITTPVNADQAEALTFLKAQGLDVNAMTRDFYDNLIERAKRGEFEGIKLSA